jgi:hypothetical protein
VVHGIFSQNCISSTVEKSRPDIYFDHFLEIAKVAHFSGKLCTTVKVTYMYALISTKKWIGLHFGLFFHKLTWSLCLQITIVLRYLIIKVKNRHRCMNWAPANAHMRLRSFILRIGICRDEFKHAGRSIHMGKTSWCYPQLTGLCM